MALTDLLEALTDYLHSEAFRDRARSARFPTAFTRTRKLPLPTLIAVMLTGLRQSVQAELDTFFGHLPEQGQRARYVTEQALAQARGKLAPGAVEALNDYWLTLLEDHGWLPRWRGLRLVAADGSKLRLGLRANSMPHAERRDKVAFGLYLPDAGVMLAASLYSNHEPERQMLFEHLDRLTTTDLLLLDRGYPSRWLVNLLNQRGIPFCMRVDPGGSGGFKAVQDFLRSDRREQVVTLPAPPARDAADYECPAHAQQVRLVRRVIPNGPSRVVMTNLMDPQRFPAADLDALYHQRWSIEEAFKRLKHRLHLEHVSGLSHQATQQDFAAKILCDNLESVVALATRQEQAIPEHKRVNRAYAHTLLEPLLPVVLRGRASGTWLKATLKRIMASLARRLYKHRPGRSQPRPPQRTKPHKHLNQKPC